MVAKFKPIMFNKEGFFCGSSWVPYRWIGVDYFLRKNDKELIKIHKVHSYFTSENKNRCLEYPERFLVKSLPNEKMIESLDERYLDCINSFGGAPARKSLFEFLSNGESLSLWDLVTWGERRFCDLEHRTEKALISMGEDIFFRAGAQGALGVILSLMLGFCDEGFLKDYYHTPYMMSLLFKGNSDLRVRGKHRPSLSQKDEVLKDDLIKIYSTYFPKNKTSFAYSVSERVATCLKGQNDHERFKGLLCAELLYVVLEKNTPIFIRHFNHLQWSNFRQDVVSKLFFNADLSFGGRLTA